MSFQLTTWCMRLVHVEFLAMVKRQIRIDFGMEISIWPAWHRRQTMWAEEQESSKCYFGEWMKHAYFWWSLKTKQHVHSHFLSCTTSVQSVLKTQYLRILNNVHCKLSNVSINWHQRVKTNSKCLSLEVECLVRKVLQLGWFIWPVLLNPYAHINQTINLFRLMTGHPLRFMYLDVVLFLFLRSQDVRKTCLKYLL